MFLLSRTAAHNEWVSGGHNKWYQSILGLTWDHLLIQRHLLLIGRDHAYLGSELGLFVGSCVDLRTMCEDCSRNQVGKYIASETLRGFRVEVKI